MSVTAKKLLAVAFGLVLGVGGPILWQGRSTHRSSIQRVIVAEEPARYQIEPLIILPPFWVIAGEDAERLIAEHVAAGGTVGIAPMTLRDGLGLREGRGRFGRLRPAEMRARIRPASTDAVAEPPAPEIVHEAAAPPLTGVLAPSDLERTINANREDFRTCGRAPGRTRGNRPPPNGKLALRWIVRANGTARDVEVRESTVDDPRFVRCVVGNVERWRFTPPDGGAALVSSSFVFSGP